MKRILYKAFNQFYSIVKTQEIRAKGCNSVSFENTGTTSMVVNDIYVIQPNGVLNITQPHPDVYDYTNYRIAFTGAGTNNGVAVITWLTPYSVEGVQLEGKEKCEQF